MSAVEQPLSLGIAGRLRSARGVFATSRFWVYLACTVLAVTISCLLGKEMMWDNLDYHFYAGFSALHDRFGRDYFAAGTQSYLNPYVYAPYYALARTGLPALWVASAFAVVQSGILWLTYELAVAIGPREDARFRTAVGACAVLFALANPILIDQLGSSFADITTAEIVLGGWLLLVHALRMPSAPRVICAGLLLGAASALKLTNALHAMAACVMLLFLPTTWRMKTWLALGFAAALAVSFIAVAAPWAIELERHFGNPFFPLLNGIFRSPHFPAVAAADYRFVPSSFAEALWRPFTIVLPLAFVDDEFSSPDLRYALLITLALVAAVLWLWRRYRRARSPGAAVQGDAPRDGFVALACAFLVDWVLWLRVSGNGRYFLAMACVAGVLAMVLAYRMLAERRGALALLLTVLFAVQGVQLAVGAEYRVSVPWDGGSWFEVSVPPALRESANLYFLIGEESESFVAPYLGKGSGFVNLAGDYVLGPAGANGARMAALIREYAGHIRVAVMASEFQPRHVQSLSDVAHVNDTLAPFGLRADTTDCATLVVRDMRTPWRKVLPGTLPLNLPQLKSKVLRIPVSPVGYMVTCSVVPDATSRLTLAAAEQEPDLVFHRMENECPSLFQPPDPVTQVWGGSQKGYLWMRKYPGTNLTAVLSRGSLSLVDGVRAGHPMPIGSENDWAKGAVALTCGRRGELYYAKAVSAPR